MTCAFARVDQSAEPVITGAAIFRQRPSTRYSEQPMSVGTRLFGMSGTLAILLTVLAGALLTWGTNAGLQPPTTLSVFDVAQPAAPPEPPSEVPRWPPIAWAWFWVMFAQASPDIRS